MHRERKKERKKRDRCTEDIPAVSRTFEVQKLTAPKLSINHRKRVQWG